jgi:hypothetical protein
MNQKSKSLQNLSDDLEEQQLPTLPVHAIVGHVAPNICLQSALFGLIEKGTRRYLKQQKVASLNGTVIWYTGEQLDQSDLDVFLHAIHLTADKKNVQPGNAVRFSMNGFLAATGKSVGGSGEKWLLGVMDRLAANMVYIEVLDSLTGMRQMYGGSLIHDFYYDHKTQTYSLRLNGSLGAMFERGWTPVQWEQRLSLSNNLSKWLHGFYNSMTTIFPMQVSKLLELSGSSCNRLSNFRAALRRSLDNLVEVGAVISWTIDNEDKIHVVRFQSQKIPGRPV